MSDRVQEMMEMVEARAQLLNRWEFSFFADITDDYANGKSLSEGQVGKLREIYERIK